MLPYYYCGQQAAYSSEGYHGTGSTLPYYGDEQAANRNQGFRSITLGDVLAAAETMRFNGKSFYYPGRRAAFTKGLLAAAVVASLGVCVLGAAVPIDEKGLSVRAQRDVAAYFDQRDLVKRADIGLVSAGLVALGGVTYAACQATAPIQPTIAATLCVVASVSTFVSAIATIWKGLYGRDADGSMVAMYSGVQYRYFYPASEDGPSPLELFQRAYVDTPILIAHHTCEGYGCYQAHYSNHFNADLNKTVHRIATSPRTVSNSSITRRQDDEEDGTATQTGGGELFTDYIFQNDNDADEAAEANDSDFSDQFLSLVGAQPSYENQGYSCMSVLDTDDSLVGAQGYFTISQDEHIADPDNEASYISSCS